MYSAMPHDPTAVVLGSDAFPAVGDGVADDTAAIQAAIDEASRRGGANWLGNIVGGARGVEVGDGGGLVFVPEGTYRISDRIDLRASVRIIGFGDTRPRFTVAPQTAAFAGEPEFMFAAVRRPYAENGPISFGNSDTFGTGLVNVDLEVGAGNPGAVGVRFGGAQMFVLQDVDIRMGDGYAGIDHNANLIQRVNVSGGRVGLLAYAASPGWQTTIIDSTFSGQTEAAVRLHTDAKLSIIRTQIIDVPVGIEATPAQTQRLSIQDSLFERVSGPAIVLNESSSVPAAEEPELVRAQNQLNVVNTGVVDTAALLRTMPSGDTWSFPAASYSVTDATLGLRVEDALGADETRHDRVQVTATALPRVALLPRLTSDIPMPPDSSTWVNIADYARAHGVTVGTGGDDRAVFQQALREHETVYVPIGQYQLSDTLELRPENNLLGLHPRQTWLALPDRAPGFAHADQPRAMLHTPEDGSNFVSGLGLDTAATNPGAVQIHWQSGARSHLSDVATQFVKWAPETTQPGNPTVGNPGYQYRGQTKYNFWIDGGGGTFVNLWAVAGYAENGFFVENTRVPGSVYEISVEHHRHHEVVLHDVHGWEFHALQTEDHIYGWESQALELESVSDILLANTVFFRVATVLGPYPFAIGIADSSDVEIRGTRGYRPDNIDNTRWGATVRDTNTGNELSALEVAYAGIDTDGRPAEPNGIALTGPASAVAVMPGERTTVELDLLYDAPAPLRDVVATAAADDLDVHAETSNTILSGSRTPVVVTIATPVDVALGSDHQVTITLSFADGQRLQIERELHVRIGGESLMEGATATASSTLSTNVAANAVDGATDGARWISGTGDPEPTLTIELVRAATPQRAVVYSGVAGSDSLRVVDFEVEGLVNDAWRPLGSATGNASSPTTVLLSSDAPVEAVRLRFTRPSPTDGLARVFEVQLFGTVE